MLKVVNNLIKLINLVNKFNNTCHRTNEINPIDVNSCVCFEFDVENNDTSSNSKVGDHVSISKYKAFLQEFILQIGQKNVLLLKILYCGLYLNCEKIAGKFYEKKFKRQIKQSLKWIR